jgi:hypothetical protein
LERGDCIVAIVIVLVEPSGFTTWGKEGRGTTTDTSASLSSMLMSTLDAVNSNPSCRAPSLPRARLWEKGATALMLWRQVWRWHWLGGEREKEIRLLVMEEVGPNNQHEAGGEGWWREIDKDNN